MTAVSGFCQFAMHPRCAGTASGDPCSCVCHQPAPAVSLHDRVLALLSGIRRDTQPDLPAAATQVIDLVRQHTRSEQSGAAA